MRDVGTPVAPRAATALVVLVLLVLLGGLAALAAAVLSGVSSDGPEPAYEQPAARQVPGPMTGGTPRLRDGPAVERPGASSWAPFATDPDGSVVRWDPCEPVRWAFSPDGAPPGGRAVVEEAVARVAAATELSWVDVGDVDEQPRSDRSTLADDGGWAPVLVGWVDDTATDLPLRRQDRGVALTVAVEGAQGRVLVTGQVALNTAWPLETSFDERHTDWGPVVMHELGHAVGLDHVDDPDQLMHRDPGFGSVAWGDGDLAGLEAVGAGGGCRPAPAPTDVEVAPPTVVSD